MIILQSITQLLQQAAMESPLVAIMATAGFTFFATVLSLVGIPLYLYRSGRISPALIHHHDQRRRLPKTIIVVRHGESEANADASLWKTIPDNLLGLTYLGRQQARDAGLRVAAILEKQNATRVHMVISPFERTLQTAHHLRPAFESRIVRTEIESRIREQEVGNLQGDKFQTYRQEQKKVGRFWYRFPTGESGADVLDRVKSWWHESVLTVNLRAGYEPVDAIVVVTHGLTMRFILTQLFGWSPTTFHSVWNADNCAVYVLQKDLKFPGISPYALSEQLGDVPRSSIDVSVSLRNGKKHLVTLDNYLGIPPPRTTQKKLIRRLLCQQYPQLFSDPKQIHEVVFMPFIEGCNMRGRAASVKNNALTQKQLRTIQSGCSYSDSSSDDEHIVDETDDQYESVSSTNLHESEKSFKSMAHNKEMSLRYPCCKGLKGLLEEIE